MTGLELSEKYFKKYGESLIEKSFPEYKSRIAAGLVGQGSECYGFDDKFSRDHDWGPGFCLWLTSKDYHEIGKKLQIGIDKLPKEIDGISERETTEFRSSRIGVFETGKFYNNFIKRNIPPVTWQEWRAIPESNLAECTNGKVFIDPLGEFSNFRSKLLSFYPEDVRLNKIARRCMCAGQSGQYNFLRAVKRKEYITAQCIETMFIEDIIALVFLLNKKYKPYFKWMHRALKGLPILGEIIYELLNKMVMISQERFDDSIYYKKYDYIKDICNCIIKELHLQNLTNSKGALLMNDHGPSVQNKIRNKEIRDLGSWSS
jgi:hypothetical protein